MTIASKSGGLILKDNKLATNCGCCCVVPAYPDTIEVDITRNSTAYGTIVFGENTADHPLGSTVHFAAGGLLYPPDGLYVLTAGTPDEYGLLMYSYTDGYTTLSLGIQQPHPFRSPGIGLNIIANFFRVKIVPGTTAPTQAELEASNWNSSCNTIYTLQHLNRGTIPPNFNTYEIESCPFMGTVGFNITRGCLEGIYSHQQYRIANNNLDGRGCYAAGCAFPAVYQYAARGTALFNSTTDLLIEHTNGSLLFRFSASNFFSRAAPGANIAATGYVSSTVNSVQLVYGASKVDAFPQTTSNCPTALSQFSYFLSQPPCP